MSETGEKIKQLQTRLDKMVEYQDYFYREINQLRSELKKLESTESSAENRGEPPVVPAVDLPKPLVAENFNAPPEPVAETAPRPPLKDNFQKDSPVDEAARSSPLPPPRTAGIEEFVGKNLISLIGIIITIIGVAIGAKYAIDRELISPAARILFGYAFAAALSAVAVWLKRKYLNFSAVLLSGALAMMYFLTFFAYSFYGLISQTAAFALMLAFTVLTVAAAVNYNRQVIAHIGLVGAYAVPFLLSQNSGRADVLFGYMTIINFGVLAISIFKFWKPLYYSSFIFTWLIYAAWFLSSYREGEHFGFALGFAATFFLTFYLTFLSYKLIAKEEFNAEIVVLVLLNSFIFYGFGYALLESRDAFKPLLGAFTLINALFNFGLALVIHRYRLGDRQNFYLAMALAVTFVTIAVPVQFEGNWVTLIWMAEALMLFWIGRTKQLAVYENLAYPLMFLGAVSLLNVWQTAFQSATIPSPIFNQNFLTAILSAAAFGLIAFIDRDERFAPAVKEIRLIAKSVFPTIFLVVLYNAFRIEIGNYFQPLIAASGNEVFAAGEISDATRRAERFGYFNILWQINYSMFFLTILSLINIHKVKNAVLGYVNLRLNFLTIFAFLSVGLHLLSELRSDYLTPLDNGTLPTEIFLILIRYVCLAFAAALLYANYQYTAQEFLNRTDSKIFSATAFDSAVHLIVLWMASSELINLMDIFGYRNSYKLGLSILWGLYGLLLIIIGIVKRRAHLRIAAIILLALTLVKLFFYDIADLDTISKTVVFLSLGILLLIISFLYNKYKDLIFEKTDG